MSENDRWEVAELIPHETIQLKLLSPFTEFLNASTFAPGHVWADFSPYHYVLGIHRTRRHHLGGARTVEVGEAKRSSSHVGVEIALLPAKEERMLWVSCQPVQLGGPVVGRPAMVKDCPRRNTCGSYGVS